MVAGNSSSFENSLPLTKVDKYHYQNKWTNNRRGGIIELHSKTKGVTGTFQYFE